MAETGRGPGSDQASITEAERWFLDHGLSYFVPRVRAEVRRGLRPRRFLPPLLGVTALAVAAAWLVVLLLDEKSAAPAVWTSFALAGALAYALTALHARAIVSWALTRTFGSLRLLVPMVSRALPLLLVFVTFLFINAEAWQMTSHLAPGVLWLTVLLLTALAVVFLLVRLPEEVDRADDAIDADFLRRTTRGTPLEAEADRIADLPGPHPPVTGFARWNLILVLLVVQIGQVLLLAVTVFAFFLLFGALVMTKAVQESWTGGPVDSLPFLPNASVELVQVSLFLAAFSGLYFTVSAVTDDTYRSQFFAAVTGELERAVGMRAVYLVLRERAT
ncbi:hypothetical protein [Nocardioides sp. GXZ039]|uniref:hypothetical protein n=1 Tax=Nocardioides sp. GXZ039 TaxID=3136018 RepID=UPI0030F406C8